MTRKPEYFFSVALILIWCAQAFALDPSLDITQYAHKTWKARDGFPRDAVQSIAQTRDGYLWLGTRSGLIRFDGVSHIEPAVRLPSPVIYALTAGPDGSLWIGTGKGLVQWKDGKSTEYRDFSGYTVPNILVDHEGTIWVGASSATGRLCSIRELNVRCEGGDGSLGRGPISSYADNHGNLWLGLMTGLSRWKPGPSTFYETPGQELLVSSLLENRSGALLVGTTAGLFRFTDGHWESQSPADKKMGVVERLLRDKDGGLWIGTNHGLLHVHDGRTDVYARSDGLSGDDVLSLYEDVEGDIWVGTVDGVDQFRSFAIPTVSRAQGLLRAPDSVLAASDGSIWVGADNGLNRLKDGSITNYPVRPVFGRNTMHEDGPAAGKAGRGTDDRTQAGAGSLAMDNQGRMWVAASDKISWFENGRFVPVTDAPGGYVYTISSDQPGSLWISHTKALIHLLGSRITERIAWEKLGSADFASSLLVDPSPGGLWLGFFQGGVAHVEHDQLRARYGQRDGVGTGTVWSLYRDEHGGLWAATDGGLSHLSNGHVKTLTTSDGLPCNTVLWIIQDDLQAFWLGTACGVLRVDQRDLEGWLIGTIRNVHPTVFDSSDGVRSSGTSALSTPSVTKSTDGRLWFKQLDGIGIIDPHHLVTNRLPPPVQIERLIGDREAYGGIPGLRLPPLVRDLQIGYTALSLVAPEKVQFRYRLEGHDRDWQSVGNRRQAFYTDLPPGHYRFRVIASNNSGVWNEKGASLDFSIAPAFWQTLWFRALCAVAFAGLLWMLYLLRARQVAREFERTLDARVDERTQVARELHDTLLQSFNAVLLHFGMAARLVRSQPEAAQKLLDETIEQARRAVKEGREAVQGLRSSVTEREEFSETLRTLTEELARDPTHGGTVDARLSIEGTPRTLRPLVRDEIYRIASEALRNAFRHAEASRIELELRYDDDCFELRVRDDGKGISSKFVAQEVPGHFGLQGMRERAERIGGKLTLWSAPGSGTEVVLSVPASAVYSKGDRTAHSWLGRKIYRRG